MNIRIFKPLPTWALLLAMASPTAIAGSALAQKSSAATEAATVTGTVNLNTASESELTRLPGIGPSKAASIAKLRDRMKGFKRVEDVMRVKGIGRKTFRDLKPMLRIEGETTLPARVRGKKKK